MAHPSKGLHADARLREIVQGFVDTLEKGGLPPWICPHKKIPQQMPQNFYSRRNYRGLNTLILWVKAQEMGYESQRWVTYKQAKILDGHVKPGEKGTQIVFWDMREDENAEPDVDTGEVKVKWIRRFYSVFNLEQTTIEPPEKIRFPEAETEQFRNAMADRFVAMTKAKIVTRKGCTPAYNPVRDLIQMPELGDFTSSDDFYSAELHELAHWTGHKSRLERLQRCSYGDSVYAFEELVAEITGAFLGAHLGVAIDKVQSERYLDHWVEWLGESPQVLWSAASKAQHAYDYLVEQVRINSEEFAEKVRANS